MPGFLLLHMFPPSCLSRLFSILQQLHICGSLRMCARAKYPIKNTGGNAIQVMEISVFQVFRSTDGRALAVGGHAAGPMRRPQSPKTSPFSLCAPPLHPLAYPQNQNIWMDVRRAPPSPSPLHLPPAAVCPHGRLIQPETQHTRPLLVGLGRVNTPPTALAAGPAGPHPLKSPNPWESPFLETPPFFPPHLSVPQNAAGGTTQHAI